MEGKPTEEEKTAVYRYCTTSRELMQKKKVYAERKKPLNAKMKSVRDDLLKSMEEKGHTCYKMGDNFLRITQCTSKKSLSIEMIMEALHSFEKNEETIEDAIELIANKMENIRSHTKQYVKLMKTPPKSKNDITEAHEADPQIVDEYRETERELLAVRKEEKESSKSLQDQVNTYINSVQGYMNRVNLNTQRIQLGDKEVKGLAHTFYLRRRQKTVSKKMSKKLMKTILLEVLPQYYSDYQNKIDFIARDILEKIEGMKETSHVLSFGKGNLELKR